MLSQRLARVIDPILTTVVRGYRQQKFVGSLLFPNVDVPASGGQVLTFGKEEFIIYATQRAPGSNTTTIDIGYLGEKYACENHALDAKVPIEMLRDAGAVPRVDVASKAVIKTWNSMLLKLEYQQSKMARNPANYDINNKMALAGTARWNDGASNPRANVADVRASIRAQTGEYPNVMILPPGGCYKLAEHPMIKDKFKHTSKESITLDMLAGYFEIETVAEGRAIYAESLDSPFSDVWGNDVCFGYVPPKELQAQETPSYGYTYGLEGHPFVATPWWDASCKSWKYGVVHERAPVISSQGGGFLLQAAFD